MTPVGSLASWQLTGCSFLILGFFPRSGSWLLSGPGKLAHSQMIAAGESRVRVYGDTAVVTARVTSTAHYLGQRLDADEWTTDVFVRRDGRWLCALTHITAAAPR